MEEEQNLNLSDLADVEELDQAEIEADLETVAEDVEGFADDSIKIYLKEIGSTPLLSLDEEEKLSAKILANRPRLIELEKKRSEFESLQTKISRSEMALAEWKRRPEGSKGRAEGVSRNTKRLEELKADVKQKRLTIREENEIKRLAAPSDHMVTANMRLVVSIAKRYLNRGLDFQDLIQEGGIGLMRAVNKFDPTRGFRFSTYATWWVRQSITRAIADQSRTVRVPVHMVDTINRLARATKKLSAKLNREPTLEELSDELDMEKGKIEQILKIRQESTSLDATISRGSGSGDEDSVLADFIEDTTQLTPEESTDKTLMLQQIAKALDVLSDRERKIIQMRYGIGGEKVHTLEEVGAEFSVTRERIRQIEAKALIRLRKHKDSVGLANFISN
ncbi:sigma-70 family RNA polymerase sigma factor [Candidatus Saccharibacteria bacterium]|nr:sigma-70 family RNA polymerase sigma factor [Candidatus Saccharibacteria bacterium]